MSNHDVIQEKIYQACYIEWLDRQLAHEINDPYRFAYEATERELGCRTALPAIHAATMGFFAGVSADLLTRWGPVEFHALPGHWVGSLPALIVGGLVYVALAMLERTWSKRLDYHVVMAIEANQRLRCES